MLKVRLVQITSSAGVVVSAFWLWNFPSWEPTTTFIASLATFFGTLAVSQEPHGSLPNSKTIRLHTSNAFHTVLRFLLGKRYRRYAPQARLVFQWPISGASKKHEIVASYIRSKDGTSTVMSITHFGPNMEPYDFAIFDGHTPSLELRDFDADGRPELAILYYCGAHSRGLYLFRLDNGEVFVPVPGGRVGSDGPGIKWEDADGDGKLEIYAWNQT